MSAGSVVSQPSKDQAPESNLVNLHEQGYVLQLKENNEKTNHQTSGTSAINESIMNDNCTLTESDMIPADFASANIVRDSRPPVKRDSVVPRQNDRFDFDRSRGITQESRRTPPHMFNATESTDIIDHMEDTQICADTTNRDKEQYQRRQLDIKPSDFVVERQGDPVSLINELKSERTALITRLHQFVCSNAELHEELEQTKIQLETETLHSKSIQDRATGLGLELARARTEIKGLQETWRLQDQKEIMSREWYGNTCVCKDENLGEELACSIKMAQRQQIQLQKLCAIIANQKQFIHSVLQERGGATSVTRQDLVSIQPSGAHDSPTPPSLQARVITPPPPLTLSVYSSQLFNNDATVTRNSPINPTACSVRVSTAVEETELPNTFYSHGFDIHSKDFHSGFSNSDIPDFSASRTVYSLPGDNFGVGCGVEVLTGNEERSLYGGPRVSTGGDEYISCRGETEMECSSLEKNNL